MPSARHVLLPDSNIWIETHLFRTPVGAAATYYVSCSGGRIVLPETVEAEIIAVGRRHAKDAAAKADSALANVQRFTTDGDVDIPTEDAVEKAIRERLDEMVSLLDRIPLSLDQTHSAFRRVLAQEAPNAEGREQFRDSIVWSVAQELALKDYVTFITNDNDFWVRGTGDMRQPRSDVHRDIVGSQGNLAIHASISSALEALKQTVEAPDHKDVARDLLKVVRPRVAEAAKDLGLDVGETRNEKISAFPTNDPHRFALSFEFTFEVVRRATADLPDARTLAVASGDCFLDLEEQAYVDIAMTSIEFVGTTTVGPHWVIYSKPKLTSPSS